LRGVEPEVNTSAEQVCAVVSFWLSQKSHGRPRDWHRLLAEMYALLGQLCALDPITSDATASAIIAEMALSEDMEEIAFHVDLLALRVQQLLATKNGRDEGSILLPSLRPAARPPIARSATVADADEGLRTFLRL
jgi:hypothetical protein